MQLGLPISVGGHALLGVMTLAWWGSSVIEPQERITIPVELVTLGDETNIRATAPEIREDPEDRPVTAAGETENPASAAEPDISEASDRPEPAIVANNDKDSSDTVTPPRNDPPQKPADDGLSLGDIENLLGGAGGGNVKDKSDTTQDGAGDKTALTATEEDLFRDRMRRCWSIDPNTPDPQQLIVEIRFELSINGEVLTAEIANQGEINRSRNTYYKPAAEEALRAIRRCEPYEFLPRSKYKEWRNITMTFSPQPEL